MSPHMEGQSPQLAVVSPMLVSQMPLLLHWLTGAAGVQTPQSWGQVAQVSELSHSPSAQTIRAAAGGTEPGAGCVEAATRRAPASHPAAAAAAAIIHQRGIDARRDAGWAGLCAAIHLSEGWRKAARYLVSQHSTAGLLPQ